ncbi:MAG: hypothetical protein MUP67_03640, partial [Acidimicrobiia bacterium]|nr:hypothetical protein [Acidimicrobiia bacterium]
MSHIDPTHIDPNHIDPGDDQISAMVESTVETPIVMVNLNRYRDRAVYDSPGPDDDVSGRAAYLRYGAVALRAMREVGAQILFGVPTEAVFVGCDHDAYDEVLAVWYPSRAAFVEMTDIAWYRDALVHRTAALEHASILACT